jgi:hypothetical protein
MPIGDELLVKRSQQRRRNGIQYGVMENFVCGDSKNGSALLSRVGATNNLQNCISDGLNIVADDRIKVADPTLVHIGIRVVEQMHGMPGVGLPHETLYDAFAVHPHR